MVKSLNLMAWALISILLPCYLYALEENKTEPSNSISTKLVPVDSRNFSTKKNLDAYTSWISSARKGDPIAQFNLGLILEQGLGVNKDLKKAIGWYKKAAGQGHTIAQYNLGTLLHFGKGVEIDETKAAYWYKLAAKRGHIVAQSSLAYLYLQHSQRSFRNVKQAAYWYNRSAKLGYPEAQFNLGLLYASGRGVLLNYQQAYAWFDLAHQNNYKNALQSRNSTANRLSKSELKEAQQLARSLVQLYFRPHPANK